MPSLSDVDMAFRLHYASYGLIGYTMKIIRGAAGSPVAHAGRSRYAHSRSHSRSMCGRNVSMTRIRLSTAPIVIRRHR
jgi:hypothetical protein